MGTTEQLANFVTETNFEALPPQVIERAKELFMDFAGGALSGSQTPAGKIVTEFVREMAARLEAGVIGGRFKTTALYASFANAVLGHSNELEAVGLEGTFNPTCNIAVSLALGEKLGLGGRDVLEGFIIGQEVQGKIGAASIAGLSKRFNLFIVFYLGSAAVASKILRLDAGQVRVALSLAASQAAGLEVQAGTMAHYLDFGNPCRSGIEAAILAKKGMTAHKDIIESPRGFCETLLGMGNYDLDQMAQGLGKTFHLVASIKKYPCCYHTHRAIDALLDLVEEYDISYEDVESVQIDINEYTASWIKYPNPRTGDEARFSFEHILGTAILEQKVWLNSFTGEIIASQKYKEARGKVKVVVHSEWLPGIEGRRSPIRLRLKDGRTLSREVSQVREPTKEELLARYTELAQPFLSSEQVDRSIELMLGLENADRIAELMNIISIAGHS